VKEGNFIKTNHCYGVHAGGASQKQCDRHRCSTFDRLHDYLYFCVIYTLGHCRRDEMFPVSSAALYMLLMKSSELTFISACETFLWARREQAVGILRYT